MEQFTFPASGPQEKTSPFRSPLMSTFCPSGSVATRSRLSSPMHQPFTPQAEQVRVALIVGSGGPVQTYSCLTQAQTSQGLFLRLQPGGTRSI
ncbi:MAG: hypothetical protein HN769_05195 [Anaerolineae bacterium]|nr:hypothetical protein [Anaerolineae bacterium]